MGKKLIVWDNYYSVGFDLIDNQHKKLIDMINELYTSFIFGEAQTKAAGIINEMVNYTDYHFKTEEKFFDKYKYPETEQHKEIHQSFVDKAIELKHGLESGQMTVTYDIMNFLRQWLIDHILKEDKKMASFFSENNINLE